MIEMVVPDGWQTSDIKNLVEKIIDNRGKTPPLSDNGYELIELNSISDSNKNPNFESVTKYVSDETYCSWFRSGHPEKGDVLVPTVGSIGQFAILDVSRGCIAQNLIGMRANKNIDNDFFYYLCNGRIVQNGISSVLMGAVQPSLKVPNFLGINVHIPPLPEQQKIASILTSVDEVIEKTQSQINKLQDLKKATMNELLTRGIGHTEFKDSPLGRIPVEWNISKLGELGKCIRGLTYSPSDIVEYGLLVLRSSNIQDGRLDFVDKVYVNVNVDDQFLTKDGDILICVRNGSRNLIGKSTLIQTALKNSTHGAFMTVFRSNINHFLQHLIKSNLFFKYVSRDIGATINSINNSNLLQYRFLIPPVIEQQKIISILDSIDSNIEEKQRKLQKNQSFKKSLMQDLLTGKVRVQVN